MKKNGLSKKFNLFKSLGACSKQVLAGLVLISSMPSAYAGLIIASGDNTPGFYANDGSLDNGVFFSNILGSGNSVFIHEASSASIGSNINSYYNGLAGVSSSYSGNSTITNASLAGVDLFVTGMQSGAFSASELTAIDNYVQAGGNIMFMGEYTYSYAGINSALASIGSSMSLIDPLMDIGNHMAAVDTDALTAGVSDFQYGYTWGVSGGTSLFRDSGQRTFMAYESTDVSEPETIVLLGLGLLALSARRRLQK